MRCISNNKNLILKNNPIYTPKQPITIHKNVNKPNIKIR